MRFDFSDGIVTRGINCFFKIWCKQIELRFSFFGRKQPKKKTVSCVLNLAVKAALSLTRNTNLLMELIKMWPIYGNDNETKRKCCCFSVRSRRRCLFQWLPSKRNAERSIKTVLNNTTTLWWRLHSVGIVLANDRILILLGVLHSLTQIVMARS